MTAYMADEQHMQCMEIWGGNEPVDRTVGVAGLDAWVFSQPFEKSTGGGDVYFVSSCATGRITRLLLADVSGHGQGVSGIAGNLRRLMQRYVNFIDQRSFVSEMNRQFVQCTSEGCFATAVVCTFFAPTNELTLCVAGHPSPLVFRAASGSWSALVRSNEQDGNLPLGIDDVKDWHQIGTKLSPGDCVLCYSDALIEARGDDGNVIGVEGLLKIINEISPENLPTIVPRLLEKLGLLRAGNLLEDDVTTLLFSATGKGNRPSLGRRILAPLRVLRGVVGSYVAGDRPAPWPEFSLASLGGAVFSPLSGMRRRK